ncbi:MAG: sensor histidine kinase [Phycisphaerae bacterium]
MAKFRALQIRHWILNTLVALGCMLLYLGGGYWLLHTAWADGQMNAAYLRARLMAESLVARPAPFHNQFTGYTFWDQQTLPLLLEHEQAYRRVAYIMIWKSDGTVVFLAPRQKGRFVLNAVFTDHTLDPTQWPSPADVTMATRTIRRLPWRPDHHTYINTTIPIPWPGAPAYLSIGYSESSFYGGFFPALRRPLLILLLTGIIAAVLLATMVFFIKRRFDKSRTHYARTILARTSLLSERGMLASVLAHEVRSPLTALRFNLHFIRDISESPNPDPDRYAALVDACEREVRRLDLMLDDFLTRTEIVGAGRDTSLNTVVTEALDFLRPALTSQDIRVITHLDSADPHVAISADELRQVLLNLCTNAQEAMSRAGTLVISTMAEPENAVLLVRDNGKGIAPEVQERMFDPFFTTKPRGSGLGLALVRRVVTGAGGGVYFESEVQRGTTFRIVLPRTFPAMAPVAVPAAALDTILGADGTANTAPPTPAKPEKGY